MTSVLVGCGSLELDADRRLEGRADGQELLWVRKGSCTIQARPVQARLEAGSLWFTPAGISRRLLAGPEGVRLVQVRWRATHAPDAPTPVADAQERVRGVMLWLEEICLRPRGLGADDPRVEHLCALLALELEEAVEAGDALEASLAHLLAHHADPALDVTELASVAGQGVFGYIRAFKARYGQTPGARLLAERLDHAVRLLEAGRSPEDAALAAGFSGSAHLGRSLRTHRGRGLRRK